MYGITAKMLRMLVENPFSGGCGYTLEDVGKMTPDQVYFRLCDEKLLSSKKKQRVVSVSGLSCAGLDFKVRKDGDAEPKKFIYPAKSKVQQVIEKRKTVKR